MNVGLPRSEWALLIEQGDQEARHKLLLLKQNELESKKKYSKELLEDMRRKQEKARLERALDQRHHELMMAQASAESTAEQQKRLQEKQRNRAYVEQLKQVMKVKDDRRRQQQQRDKSGVYADQFPRTESKKKDSHVLEYNRWQIQLKKDRRKELQSQDKQYQEAQKVQAQLQEQSRRQVLNKLSSGYHQDEVVFNIYRQIKEDQTRQLMQRERKQSQHAKRKQLEEEAELVQKAEWRVQRSQSYRQGLLREMQEKKEKERREKSESMHMYEGLVIGSNSAKRRNKDYLQQLKGQVDDKMTRRLFQKYMTQDELRLNRVVLQRAVEKDSPNPRTKTAESEIEHVRDRLRPLGQGKTPLGRF